MMHVAVVSERPLLPLKPPVSPASSGAPSPQSMVGSPLTPQPSKSLLS